VNRQWIVLALVVAVALVVAGGCVVAADKVDIAGKYACEGTNPAGKAYKGTVEITKVGDAYRLDWSLGGGAETYDGIGILEGDVLAVSWGAGVVVYKVEKGKLLGKWTTPDAKGKVFTETLTK
jgi:hypothetical protein